MTHNTLHKQCSVTISFKKGRNQDPQKTQIRVYSYRKEITDNFMLNKISMTIVFCNRKKYGISLSNITFIVILTSSKINQQMETFQYKKIENSVKLYLCCQHLSVLGKKIGGGKYPTRQCYRGLWLEARQTLEFLIHGAVQYPTPPRALQSIKKQHPLATLWCLMATQGAISM